MDTAPSPYFEHNPKLQRAWDSTSLRALMFCPRFYQYSILEGWRGSTLDLEFGILAHGAFETFHKARLEGKSKADATMDAVVYAVSKSGHYEECVSRSFPPHLEGGAEDTEYDKWVPWGGRYTLQWRCTGTEPYRNKKGNKAKCPYSHAGKWHDTEVPSVCGECGSAVQFEENWLPADRAKDRLGLVRMVVWWCDEQPDEFGTGLDPYKFENGTPAVELSFKIPLPFSPDFSTEDTVGPYILCGHLDGLAQLGHELFVRDHKTTKKSLGKAFFSGFAPNIQTDTYDLAGSLLFQDLGIRGLVIDGVQLLVGGAKFGAQVFYRSEAQRDEFFAELEWWLRQAERYAAADYWPMNRQACWLCQFNGVCSKEPSMRQQYLAADFKQQKWNPLEER